MCKFYNSKKKQGTYLPYFSGCWIIKSELVKNLFFHPKTNGKLNLNDKIRKSRGHFRKKWGAQEIGRIRKVIVYIIMAMRVNVKCTG